MDIIYRVAHINNDEEDIRHFGDSPQLPPSLQVKLIPAQLPVGKSRLQLLTEEPEVSVLAGIELLPGHVFVPGRAVGITKAGGEEELSVSLQFNLRHGFNGNIVRCLLGLLLLWGQLLEF